MTSLTERLTGKGTGQAMEYEEELVHNTLMAARNTAVSIAKKVKDNVLHVMTAPVIMPPSAMPKNPEANPAARHPTKGAQYPHHQVGTYAYRQAQGGQAVA